MENNTELVPYQIWEHLNGVMFDLETISQRSDACIMSMGAVRFNIVTGVIDRPFRVSLSLQEGLALGLHKQKSTMDWWQSQSPEVLKANLLDAVPYKEGITSFVDYILAIKPRMLWAWGSHFDIPIVENSIFKVLSEDFKLPWKYYQVCDARTIKNVFQNEIARSECAHDALQDVRDQAQYLIDTFRELGE